MAPRRPDEDLGTPAAALAAKAVRSQRRLVGRALAGVGGAGRRGAKAERAVHQVRVATRRTTAAVDAFEALVPTKRARRARKALKAIRKAGAGVRDADVLLAWLKKLKHETSAGAPISPAIEHLVGRLRDDRKSNWREFEQDLPRLRSRALERLDAVLDSLEGRAKRAPSPGQQARCVLERLGDEVLVAAAADLRDAECMHQLRIACKHLRYGLELFTPTIGKRAARPLLTALESFQEQVGGFTDASTRVAFLDREIAALARSAQSNNRAPKRGKSTTIAAAMAGLLKSERAALRREHRAACAAWKALSESDFYDRLRSAVFPPVSPAQALARDASAPPTGSSTARPSPPASAGSNGTANGVHRAGVAGGKPERRGRRRLAAIDIGTNSIRLIVAEASQEGSYRVLDDEKEITRLGRGLQKSGRLDESAQEHSAVTVARMKSIAEGYGATEICVAATAACREASNTGEFLARVKERAGLDVEVIPAEQEALLAYRSAAGAFDLAGVPAAVVDIGGGSLEVVLSAGAGASDARGAGLGGGVIERVFSLPLGAVRLTEQFGGAQRASGKRFGEMTSHVDRVLRKAVGKPPFAPQLVIGTGGTFTTLGTILAHKELGPAAHGLFSGSLQGRQVRRSELRHVLDFLRKLPVRERARVPGLPADRADIIVAGLAVIDRLLDRLDANSFLVHEGGIRDGLLLSMVRPAGGDGRGPRDAHPLRSVKRFARACSYEAAHAGHVAYLALRTFDQLAEQASDLRPHRGDAGTRFAPRDRVLLEAAAILHDVGYLVNYAAHHKHSYHLIVHADLPGFTTREVQVIANVARYHRAAEPKAGHANFAALADEDRGRVRALAAILRVADGLDRTHMQQVQDVVVSVRRDAAHFVVASEAEPAVDIWGAARKARLFARVFGLLPHFEWRRVRSERGPDSGDGSHALNLGSLGERGAVPQGLTGETPTG